MQFKHIDEGNPFDFGKTSQDYAKFRDIYPNSMYENLYEFGIAKKDDYVLDIGTGTGVLPRAMQKTGAHFVGIDISKEQIDMAKKLSESLNYDIEYKVCPAEDTGMPSKTFDAVTACQCFLYFDKETVLPEIVRVLKPGGLFATIWMTWLPYEDDIAKASEDLAKKYNPTWTGAGYTREDIYVPDWSKELFEIKDMITYDEYIPFTQESWLGRMRACRGVAASLDENEIKKFDAEHKEILSKIAPEDFSVLHQIIIHVFKAK